MSEEPHKGAKTQLALAVAQGLRVAAWARTNGVPRRTAFRWATDGSARRAGVMVAGPHNRTERLWIGRTFAERKATIGGAGGPWPGDRPPADGTDPFAERRATMGRCMSLASPRCLDRCRWLARAHRAARCPGGRSPAPRGSPRADGGYPRQPSTSEQTARRWSLVA
jgi:hypothetical protein